MSIEKFIDAQKGRESIRVINDNGADRKNTVIMFVDDWTVTYAHKRDFRVDVLTYDKDGKNDKVEIPLRFFNLELFLD